MSFAVTFFKFNKKPNSTKHPDPTSGTVFQCDFWGSFDMSRPVLKVEAGMDVITKYTYCSISIWGKMYFVDTYGWDNGHVTVTLKPDPMGTYWEFITARSQFILRTSVQSQVDSYLPDNTYPAHTNYRSEHILVGNFFESIGGCFVVEAVGVGGSVFYVMNRGNFNTLTDWMFGQPRENFWTTVIDTTISSMVGTFLQPTEYIKGVYWLPIDAPSPNTTVSLGYWQTGAPANVFTPSGILLAKSFNFTIEKTPTSIPGLTDYMDYPPYARASIYLPYSGKYPLNINVGRSFKVTGRVDMRGNILYIVEQSITGDIILRAEGRVGMGISVGQNGINVLGAIGSAIGTAAGAAGQNPAVAAGGVLSIAQSLIPDTNIVGGGGGGAADNFSIYAEHEWTNITQGATELGYPCYKNLLPSETGWYKCADAKIDWIDEMYEYDITKEYMDNGFFVE